MSEFGLEFRVRAAGVEEALYTVSYMPSFLRAYVPQILNAAAEDARVGAQAAAPVRTGFLAGSIYRRLGFREIGTWRLARLRAVGSAP